MSIIFTSLFIAAFAYFSAKYDASLPTTITRSGHIIRWLLRAAVATVWCLFFGILFWLLGLAGLFSAVLRYTFNKDRGNDYRYVSPSNWYDIVFMWRTGAWAWKPSNWEWSNWLSFLKHQHIGYELDEVYEAQVHKAGALAYRVELLAYGVTVLLAWL